MKIRVVEDGKQFEAYVKFVILDNDEIVGISYANNFTSCRGIHASLYGNNVLELIYDDGRIRRVRSSKYFRRIENIDDVICHHTLLPRSTSDAEYQRDLTEMLRKNDSYYPARVILAPEGNIIRIAGQFISETFGLPRKEDWVDHYVSLLGHNCKPLEVITTSLAGEWVNLQALKIERLKEEDVLTWVQNYIQLGMLQTRSVSFFGEATFTEDMTTEEYLRTNAEVLGKKLDVTMKPLTYGDKLDSCIGELKRIPVPVQAKASVAALEVLKQKKGVFVVGEMGTGKTQISLTSVYIQHKRRIQSGAKTGTRVLIVAPANVLPKWANLEIPKILPKGSYKVRILSSTGDAVDYINDCESGNTVPRDLIEFVLVSTDRMKLGPQGYVLGARWDANRQVWISPDTGVALEKPNATIEERKDPTLAIAEWKDAVDIPKLPPTMQDIADAKTNGELLSNGLPRGYVKKWSSNVRNFQNVYGEGKTHRSLARPALKSLGETKGKARWAIAELFQRKLENHFHIGIFDEVHQSKAAGSGRGLALHKIMKSARRHIYLTGTLTNGTSTSIKSLLWRAFPKEMLDKGIHYQTSDEQFAQRYGVLEKIKTINDDGITGVYTKQKKDTTIVKEKPGISPKLIADFLLDKCIFVELSDLGVPLVKLEEVPKIISLDSDHEQEYKKFHREHYDSAIAYQKEIGSAAWSRFNSSTINYADQPQLGASVVIGRYDKYDNYEVLTSINAPKFPTDYETAKERQLLSDIESELMNKRHCIVFTHYSGDFKTNERLKTLIENRGYSCSIMNEKVKTAERVDWLDAQVKAGTEVLVMNQRLVEVGLDLMEFPTIMFYQMNDDINVVRQASRRAWRLGQHRNCKVYYYVADETTQLVQFQRLMSRRVAALIVEGRIERSDDLAKYANQSSNTSGVSDLTKSLSSIELTNAWISVANKDIDSELEIVSEVEFQDRVSEAFTLLTNETIQTCGYTPPITTDEAEQQSTQQLDATEPILIAKAVINIEKNIQKQSSKNEIAIEQLQLIEKMTNESKEKVRYKQLDLFEMMDF